MKHRDLQAVNARLDILGMTVVELARSMSTDEARRAAEGIRQRINGRILRAARAADLGEGGPLSQHTATKGVEGQAVLRNGWACFSPPMPETYLQTAYKDRERLKGLGVRWDPARRQWYVPDGRDLAPFAT